MLKLLTHSLSLVLGALALVGCAASGVTPQVAPDGEKGFGLVIDASSSASTLFAYRWRGGRDGGLPRIEVLELGDNPDCDPVEPGLGDYGGRPAAAVAALEPLLRCAQELTGGNAEALARTALLLRGTAGLRLLPETEREEILEAVRAAFAAIPFGTTSARVISGAEEGIFGWIAVNYLLGHLEHGGPFPTVGALDLGGASTQITFVPLDHPRAHGQAITLAGNTYHLYTYSYLGLGQDEARASVASPACYLDGYPIPGGGTGTGDYEECRAAIRMKLGRPCDERPCSLFGVYQPPPYGDFLAFSVYAYTARFFDIEGALSPARLERAGRAFCAQRWQALVDDDPTVAANPYFPNYCFSAAYVVTLLADAFGLAFETERVHAPIEVQGTRVGWALGALLYELAGSGD